MLTPVKLWLLVMDLEVRRLAGRTDSDMVERVRDGLPPYPLYMVAVVVDVQSF